MTRVSPRLLSLLGALLLALWVVSPLSSSPPVRLSPAAAPDVASQVALDEMNREVDRLEARLSRPVRPAAPDRDPFQFAPAAGPYLASPGIAAPSDAGVQPRTAAVTWPTLVAILTTGSEQPPERRAVLEDAAGVVRILGIGERVGDVTVSAIRDGVVTLTHAATEQSTTLSLQ